jgi:hypothetical protein
MNLKISGADVLAAAKYLHETHIAALSLPMLTHNALTHAGVETLADLVSIDVAKVDGIGHGGLLGVRAALAREGYTLNEQQPDPFFVPSKWDPDRKNEE